MRRPTLTEALIIAIPAVVIVGALVAINVTSDGPKAITPIGVPGPVQTGPDRAPGWTILVPPCASEDDPTPGCAWDAAARGNGKGDSFVVIGEVDGHPGCRAYVGPTSILRCEDGFSETS